MRFANSSNPRILKKGVDEGRFKQIARGVYLEGVEMEDPAKAIADNIGDVFTQLSVTGTVAYASGVKWPNAHNGIYILTASRNKTIELKECDIIIKVYKANKQEADERETYPNSDCGCRVPSPARYVLENYSTRRRDQVKIDKKFVKVWLGKQIEIYNGKEEDILRIIDSLAMAGELLGREEEAQRAIEDVRELQQQFLSAYNGEPYDAGRVEKFKYLKEALIGHSFMPINGVDYSDTGLRENLAFFESYFSNYIEGTKFKIDEAVDILIHKKPYERHKDGHDILQHQDMTLEHSDMLKFGSFDEMINTLKKGHKHLMGHRGETGEFKTKENQVGVRVFVMPEKVFGTLRKAYELYEKIEDPIRRAFFMTVCFVEVHPFTDGNGRLGRIVMNTLLQREGRQRLIVPTVLREDYTLGLQAFTQKSDMKAVVSLLEKIIKTNNSIDYRGSLDDIIAYLDGKSAFLEPNEGKWGEAPEKKEDPLDGIVPWG